MLIFPERSYVILGAVKDFSDALIAFCYDRQVDCNPLAAPAYFSALKDIASMRMSEALETKAVILESQGQVAQKDIDNAYTYFGIDPAHATFILEDHILDSYRARLHDLDANQQSTAKENLRIIAQSIDSDKLKAAILQSKPCPECLHRNISDFST